MKKRLLALLLPAALAAIWLWPGAPPPQQHQSGLPLLAIPADIPGARPGARPAAAPPAPASATPLINALERASDLRAAYERYQDMPDAAGRNAAYRAWSACFPTFVAPQGQAMSLDSVVRALAPDKPDNLPRIDAYRALMGRCKNFSDLPRERIIGETERQHSALAGGAALAPGQLAARLLSEGDTGAALAAARAIVAARDPAAIDSLREFINQYLVLQVDGQNTPPDVRPDLRSLAFSIAACNMGLACGADSLTALQQCANSGACSGGVVERYLASVPEPADRARLLRESRQVTDAIAAGDYRALGL